MRLRILFFLLITGPTLLKAQIQRTLGSNWAFQSDGISYIDSSDHSEINKNLFEKWYTAEVPGVVQSDLLRNGLIPDPWFGTNEKKVQWIENHDWVYRCSFNISKEELQNEHIDILFQGLDTYAEVYLNDFLIISADNMFRSWRAEIRKYLREGQNDLEVTFKSVKDVNRYKTQKLGYELPAGSENIKLKVSPFTRKAPYHFGWDWGPRLVTSGIWRPVKLEFWNEIKIEDINIIQKSLTDSLAVLIIETSVKSNTEGVYQLYINDRKQDINLSGKDRKFVYNYEIKNPQRWWPNGWGEAYLYPFKVEIKKDEKILASKEKKIGLRTIELVQEDEKSGRSFYFKVNGHTIFIKGANYIPQSHFLPSVSEKQYNSLIRDAKKVHMNMLRVWGGGIYENDIFYDLCDEAGIMVWQDFMFAGSMYPGDDAFIENVRQEVRENIIRLRNHPCLALWNGNNEMNVAWFNWGWQKQYGWSATDSAKIRQDYQKIFHKLIPEQIKELDPERFYTPTSPLSNWGKPENFNYGSMHYWGVWHGKDNFEDYRKNVGRFMAEYGFQSFPEMSSILKFADSSKLDLESETMKWHQKSYVGNSMILKHSEKYFGKAKYFEDFVNKSQQTQSLAMQIAIDAHRLKKGHCWGTLYWQFNDCWPGPSWSSRDVYGNWKILHKQLETLFAPIALIPVTKGRKVFFYLTNDLPISEDIEVRILKKGKLIFEKNLKISSNDIFEIFENRVRKNIEYKLFIFKNGSRIFLRHFTM